jgi:alpha-glucoside transport system substrate-binding protein
MMSHDRCRMAILQGELTPEVEAHMGRCAACAHVAAAMTAVQADLRRLPLPIARLPERALERIRAADAVRTTEGAPRVARTHAIGGGLRGATRHLLVGLATLAAVAIVGFAIERMSVSSSAAIAMTPLTPYCGNVGSGHAGAGGGQGLKGQHVLVAGVWRAKERAKFARVLRRFEQMTGAEVTFAYESRNIAPVLNARLKRDCPPDVALLPQPGLLAQLAGQHALQPIEHVAGDLVRRNYPASWRALGEFDHKLYGVWFKAANKSTIWYRPALFRDAGVRPPKTWSQLTRTAGRLAAGGVAPFSIAGADGWTLTDWFENVYLRTAGPDLYDKLTRHEIRWTDPSVRHALKLLAQVLRPDWLGGRVTSALDTTFEASVRHVFGERPDAAMVYEGDFVDSHLPDDARTNLGQDADYFAFPAIERSEPAAVVGGDVAVLFTRSAAAKSLIRFLATPAAAEPWANAGGFVSPNKNLRLDAYTDPINRRSATALRKAGTIRFDLSDQQQPAFGATVGQGMWEILRDYLAHPRELDTVTRQLENAATTAHECGQALPQC